MPGKIKRFWIIVSTRYTRCIKAKFTTNSYQYSLFHLHKIHLCTRSYRIPGCCYTQHCHYSCVLRWHTRRYLNQQKESKWKTFNWMVWLQTFRFDIVCLPDLLRFYCLMYKSYKVTFDNLPMPGKIKCFWIVSTRSTRFFKPNFTTISYRCSLFHLHEIHLCTCSYRILWCCYKLHYHYSCVLRWHTRQYLKTTKGMYLETFN